MHAFTGWKNLIICKEVSIFEVDFPSIGEELVNFTQSGWCLRFFTFL